MAINRRDLINATLSKLQNTFSNVSTGLSSSKYSPQNFIAPKVQNLLSDVGRDTQSFGSMVQSFGKKTSGFDDPFSALGQTIRNPIKTTLKDPTGIKRVTSLGTYLAGDSLQDLGATYQSMGRGGVREPFRSARATASEVLGGNFDALNTQQAREGFGLLELTPLGLVGDVSDVGKLGAKNIDEAQNLIDIARKGADDLTKALGDTGRTFEAVVKRVEELFPNEFDFKNADPEQIDSAMAKIMGGDITPIVVAEDGGIIDGTHRYLAHLRLGTKNLPVVIQREADKALGKIADLGDPLIQEARKYKNVEEAAGFGAGIEPQLDDEGNITGFGYDPVKGVAGFGAALGVKNIKNVKFDNDIISAAKKDIGQRAVTKASLRQGFDTFYTNWVNRFHPVEKLVKGMDADIPTRDNPLYAITRLMGSGGTAELRHKNTLKPIIESLGDVSKEDFDVFLKAKRDIELSSRGIQGSDAQRAEQIIEALGNRYDLKQLNEVAEMLYGYQSRGLDMLEEAGFIDVAAKENISRLNQKYVPFERVMDDVNNYLGLPTSVAHNPSQPIKKIKGSDRAILSPLESIVANTYKVEAAVAKNRVAKSIASLRSLSPELSELIKPVKNAGDNTISVWEGGKKAYYQVPKEISDVVKGLNEENVNLVTKIMSAPARVLRQQATGRNLDFMLPNIFRDQWDAAINAKYGYVPFLDYFNGLRRLINHQRGAGDDVVESWLNSGGGIFFENMAGRKAVREQIADFTKQRSLLRKLGNWAIGGIETIGKYSETPTRIGVFDRALKATDDPLVAAYESREATLDFARMGAKMKTANSIVPFLNVSVQGFDKMLRTAKNNPKATALRLATVAGLPAAVTSVYNNKYYPDLYARIPDFEKEGNFIIVTGQNEEKDPEYIKIPKGHIGALVANPTEHLITWLAGNDQQTFNQLAMSMLSDTLPVVGGGNTPEEITRRTVGQNIPQIFKPLAEDVTNTNFYTGREIVPFYMQDKPPSQQFLKSTPGVYKVVGGVLGASPLRIKNFAESTLAGGVKQPINLLETAQSLGRNQSPDINKIPIARRFKGSYADFDLDRPEESNELSFGKRLEMLFPKAHASTEDTPISTELEYYDENGTYQKISLEKPPEGAVERAKWEQEAYGVAKKVLNDKNIPKDERDAFLEGVGLDIDDVEYYDMASENYTIRSIYAREQARNIATSSNDRVKMLQALVDMRKQINGKMILTSSVIDDLVDEGLLTKDEGKKLKKVEWNLQGDDLVPEVSVTGRGKSAKLKKIKFVPLSLDFKKTKLPSPSRFKLSTPTSLSNAKISVPNIKAPTLQQPQFKVKFDL